jgi:hypothetical protein
MITFIVPPGNGLFDSYADPVHVESGFHLMAPYDKVENSFKLFLERGRRHVGKRETYE